MNGHRMNTVRTIVIFCSIVASLSMVNQRQCQAKDKLTVVTTTTNLESIAKTIGGDRANVFALATGKEDPHFIEAKPSYMLKAKNADLWIRNGLELEIGYEGLILEGSRNPKIRIGSTGHLDASAGIIPLEVPTQKIDRSMGDVHPLGNPHYWLDPYNGRIMAQNIGRRLTQLDPDHKEEYQRNLDSFLLKLDTAMFGEQPVRALSGERLWKMQSNGELESFIQDFNQKIKQANPGTEQPLTLGGWYAKLKPFEHAKLVTFHRSWIYFARRFHLDVVAELEPKPGIPPGPAHIRDVMDTMKSAKAGIILMEPFYNQVDAKTVAEKVDAKVVLAATAVYGQEQATDYIALFDNIISRLTPSLREVSK